MHKRFAKPARQRSQPVAGEILVAEKQNTMFQQTLVDFGNELVGQLRGEINPGDLGSQHRQAVEFQIFPHRRYWNRQTNESASLISNRQPQRLRRQDFS
ncbi:MAG: hypothetical protein AAGA23_14705 [Pseudomonadota bacterium]